MRRRALLGTAAAAVVAGRYLARARARNDGDATGRSAADADLDLLSAQVVALRELASDVEQRPDEGRVYDFSIRWGTWLAGRLHRLVHYYDAGELSAAERDRYEQLLRELHDVQPLIDDLGLARPPSASAR